MKRTRVAFTLAMLLFIASSSAAQRNGPVEGMWSDPPNTPEGVACYFFCTDVGLERLNQLLDDPANDSRPFAQLRRDAEVHQRDSYIRPRLTEAAAKDL